MLTVEFIDRAPTVRFYDHTGHMSAAVCCETSLHALTDGRRHDHREGCEDAISRGREGVKLMVIPSEVSSLVASIPPLVSDASSVAGVFMSRALHKISIRTRGPARYVYLTRVPESQRAKRFRELIRRVAGTQ